MRSQKFVINCCGLRPPESQSELHWNMAASIFNQKEFPQHNHTSYKKRFYTIECYEGQREGTYEERKHLGASFQPGCAQVHGALMCFFQYNAPTELLITKFTVRAGGGLQHTGCGFSSMLFLGNELLLNSSNHIKVNIQGKVNPLSSGAHTRILSSFEIPFQIQFASEGCDWTLGLSDCIIHVV